MYIYKAAQGWAIKMSSQAQWHARAMYKYKAAQMAWICSKRQAYMLLGAIQCNGTRSYLPVSIASKHLATETSSLKPRRRHRKDGFRLVEGLQ